MTAPVCRLASLASRSDGRWIDLPARDDLGAAGCLVDPAFSARGPGELEVLDLVRHVRLLGLDPAHSSALSRRRPASRQMVCRQVGLPLTSWGIHPNGCARSYSSPAPGRSSVSCTGGCLPPGRGRAGQRRALRCRERLTDVVDQLIGGCAALTVHPPGGRTVVSWCAGGTPGPWSWRPGPSDASGVFPLNRSNQF